MPPAPALLPPVATLPPVAAPPDALTAPLPAARGFGAGGKFEQSAPAQRSGGDAPTLWDLEPNLGAVARAAQGKPQRWNHFYETAAREVVERGGDGHSDQRIGRRAAARADTRRGKQQTNLKPFGASGIRSEMKMHWELLLPFCMSACGNGYAPSEGVGGGAGTGGSSSGMASVARLSSLPTAH